MLVRPRVGSGTSTVGERQQRWVRTFCIAVVLVQIPLGVGLYRQSGWATSLWPLPDARMTYIFLASIVAAVAAPMAWAAWRNELGVLRAIGVELMVGTSGVGLYLLWLALDRGGRDFVIAGTMFVAFGMVWAVIGRWARRVPLNDPRPLPVLFRAGFVGFCCVLVPVGVTLIIQVENVLPWTLSPENSTVIGLIFISAALLFARAVAHPRWAYGEMALTSFLAYDLVLFVPYFDLVRNRNDAATVSSYYGSLGYAGVSADAGINELSLGVYLGVLAVSALLAVGIYVWGVMVTPAGRPALGD